MSDATLLALATAGSYGFAFLYEAGYLKRFGVPLSLVRVELQSALVAALSMASLLWVLFAAANMLAMLLPEKAELRGKVIRVFGTTLIPVVHLLLYGFRREDVWLYVFFFGLILVFEVLWPLLVFEGSPQEKIVADERAEDVPRSRGLLARFQAATGMGGELLMVLYLGAFFVYEAGAADAAKRTDFYVSTVHEPLVALRIYPDITILAPIDLKTGTISRGLQVRRTTEMEAPMVERRIGPLKRPPLVEQGQKPETSPVARVSPSIGSPSD